METLIRSMLLESLKSADYDRLCVVLFSNFCDQIPIRSTLMEDFFVCIVSGCAFVFVCVSLCVYMCTCTCVEFHMSVEARG